MRPNSGKPSPAAVTPAGMAESAESAQAGVQPPMKRRHFLGLSAGAAGLGLGQVTGLGLLGASLSACGGGDDLAAVGSDRAQLQAATPAAAGPQRYYVLVLAGEANMQGWGSHLPQPEGIDAPHPRIRQLARRRTVSRGGPACAYNALIPADHCLHHLDDADSYTHPLALQEALKSAQRNLLDNGSFELSAVAAAAAQAGFETDYTRASAVTAPGQIALTATPPTDWGLGATVGRNGRSDAFLMVDSSSDSRKAFWKQTVALEPGKTYALSFWVMTNFNPPTLQLSVNGSAVSSQALGASRGWAPVQFEFTATSRSATLALNNLNTRAQGNDFGLDDLTLVQTGAWLSPNLIRNGDFAQKPVYATPYTSDYALRNQAEGTGTYGVVAAPPAGWGMGATSARDGQKFLMADGAADARKRIWSQTVAVEAGATYRFSYWICAGQLNTPIVQLVVNGQPFGAAYKTTPGMPWTQVTQSITVPAGTRQLSLALQDLVTPAVGNDLGLDDFQLVRTSDLPTVDTLANYGLPGPGLQIARQLLPYLPDNTGLLLVPCARSESGFSGADAAWTGGSDTRSTRWGVSGGMNAGGRSGLYMDLLSRTQTALQMNPGNQLLGVIWMQGESDLGQTGHREAFEAQLATFRADMAGFDAQCVTGSAATVPWVCGDTLSAYGEGELASPAAYDAVYGNSYARSRQNGVAFVRFMHQGADGVSGAVTPSGRYDQDPDRPDAGYIGSSHWAPGSRVTDSKRYFSGWSQITLVAPRLATGLVAETWRQDSTHSALRYPAWLSALPGSPAAVPIDAPWGPDDVAVLICCGQSNSVAMAALSAADRTPANAPLANVFMLSRSANTSYTNNDVVWAPLESDSGQSRIGSGRDIWQGDRIMSRNSATVPHLVGKMWQAEKSRNPGLPDLYCIHIAVSSMGIALSNLVWAGQTAASNGWAPELPDNDTTSLYHLSVNLFQKAIRNLIRAGKRPRLIGVDWNQWEQDAQIAANSIPGGVINQYPANLQKIVDGFSRATGAPDLRFFLHYPRATAASYNSKLMAFQFDEIVRRDPQRYFVINSKDRPAGTAEFSGDGVHYSASTYRWFADVIFNRVIRDGQRGVVPRLGLVT
ncbi:sialate O-acetylesterase [Amphibiibacter pelophylacis]|uniref:Sialate O-acetylesterase n=1 Tax=Amphibiibacter pelophylacis TaxID=1799477 RepID=A0ACC6P3X0_9BURK